MCVRAEQIMEIGRFALALVGHFLASLLYVLQRLHLVEAVVDTSSILEHREELRELWEKRMMADDNQSSSPSTTAETNSKPLLEEETEEKVVKGEIEMNNQHKMSNGLSNGFVKHSDEPDSNANHIHESVEKAKCESQSADADHENNNSADSLEEDNVEDYIEQKTYTSNLEQALIITEVKEVASSETLVSTTAVEEMTESREIQMETRTEEVITSSTTEEHQTEAVETVEVQKTEELVTKAVEGHVTSSEEKSGEKEAVQETVSGSDEIPSSTQVEETVVLEHKSTFESVSDKIVIPDVSQGDDDDDGFVRVEECLPKDDNADVPLDLPEDHDEQNIDHDVPSPSGFEEQSLPVSPVSSTSSEKVSHPEMEQFVKSGGVKRIIPGVQKTEQPYSTCTTETKIAMEIREMREREEELRIMREQAALSPVASPVPPKTPSVRSPSPSPKEGLSPTPQGPGYRVSSVFGHRGISPSPSIEEEKKPLKTFNKESAVEKEIRLAKDREEELRKQKGLPPREDDSYVKPSQVKSSQVRVFGKMVGTNNSNIKQAATAKIQMEIEEQTQREMALRETGHIQTISQERTDAKVAKLKTAETVPQTNGNSHSPVNGNYTNGRSSPDTGVPYKRSSPSPTNARPASIFAQNNGLSKSNISMHKFISSKGKETTFSSPRNGPFQPKEETVSRSAVPPPMVKLKRNVSVESKIQQEIMEMKQREDELRKMHMNASNGNSVSDENENENGTEHEMNQKNNLEYENGNGVSDEEISPRHNKLIAQWEQRIQKAES